MSVIGEIRVSLDAIGYEQQVLLFGFLASYPLALGGLLGARGKRIARYTAAVSMIGFAAMTDPWFHGVLLVVMVVAGMGLFIAAVYGLDFLQRSVLRVQPALEPVEAELPSPMSDSLPGREERRRKLRLTGRAGTT
ncbi:hypothetical protein [Piscinibacter sp. XHJ-5]|uniref:hypothetical protein n=1 Tax=Piscinibacter sp. XHJ-5 TaxID=3037797 RepID=UPI00245283FE|nr:hypothetical protein [Piscinibacter sp. XHJ-5]